MAGSGNQKLGGIEIDVILSLDQLKKGQADIVSAIQKLNPEFGKAEKGMKGMEDQAGKTGSMFKTFTGSIIAANIAMRLYNDAIGLVSDMAEFDKNMRNVNTILKANDENFTKVRLGVIELSKTIPQTASQLADGLYKILSAGIPAGEAMQFLQTSAIAATAGLSDTGTAVLGISAVIRAYNLDFSQANTVSDLFFKSVELGQQTFGELAGSIQGVTAVAHQNGVSLNELFAIYGTLTGVTGDAANVTTQLKSALFALGAPTPEAAKKFKALGVDVGEAAIKQKGFVTVAKEVYDAVGGNSQALRQLVPEIRGTIAITALATSQNATFTSYLEKMQGSLGSTKAAFDEQSKSVDFQYQILKNNLSAAFQALGVLILPIVAKELGATTDALGKTGEQMTVLDEIVLFLAKTFIHLMDAITLVSVGLDTIVTKAKVAYLEVQNALQNPTPGAPPALIDLNPKIKAQDDAWFNKMSTDLMEKAHPGSVAEAQKSIAENTAKINELNAGVDKHASDAFDKITARETELENFQKSFLARGGTSAIGQSKTLKELFPDQAEGSPFPASGSNAEENKRKERIKKLEEELNKRSKEFYDAKEKDVKTLKDEYDTWTKKIQEVQDKLKKLRDDHAGVQKDMRTELRQTIDEISNLTKEFEKANAEAKKSFTKNVGGKFVDAQSQLIQLDAQEKSIRSTTFVSTAEQEKLDKIKGLLKGIDDLKAKGDVSNAAIAQSSLDQSYNSLDNKDLGDITKNRYAAQKEVDLGKTILSPDDIKASQQYAGLSDIGKAQADYNDEAKQRQKDYDETKKVMDEKKTILDAYLNGKIASVKASDNLENQLIIEKLKDEDKTYAVKLKGLTNHLKMTVDAETNAIAVVNRANEFHTRQLIARWAAVKKMRDAALGISEEQHKEEVEIAAPGFAGGGMIVGPGTGTSDSIPAFLSDGEFVVKAQAATMYRPLLEQMNALQLANVHAPSLPGGTPAGAGAGVTANDNRQANVHIDARGADVNPDALARQIQWYQRFS